MVLIGIPAQNDKLYDRFIFIKREIENYASQTHQKEKIVVMPQINIYEIKLDMI
jgi:hypothetical protein